MKLSLQHTTRENNLIHRLQQGDSTCVGEIYDAYGEVLYGVILKIVQKKDIAEDILQEVFMKIWNKGNQYDATKGRFFTWMLNVARNTAIDYMRSADYKNESIKHVDISKADNPVKTDFEEKIGVKEMVFSLDPKYQEIIDLLYFKGFTHAEAADNLGIPLGTVKTRARLAIKELKEKIT